jgi:hypothetical protein
MSTAVAMQEITMTRKDWGELSNGTGRTETSKTVLERIGKLRWEGKTHADDDEPLTVQLSSAEVAAIFDRKDGFARGGYRNTVETYNTIARMFVAFGFEPPKEQLPHGDYFKYFE